MPRDKEPKQDWVFGLYNNRPRSSSGKSKAPPLRRAGDNKHQITGLNWKFYRWFFLLLVIFSLVWIPYVNVSCQTQKGISCEHGDDYQSVIKQSYPGILRFTPLLDEEYIVNNPQLIMYSSQIDINRGIFNILNVAITERSPYVIWSSRDNRENKIIVDKYGIGYRIAPEDFDDTGLIAVIDDAIRDPELGTGLVTPESINYLLRIKNNEAMPGFLLRRAVIDEAIKELTVVVTEVQTQKDIKVKLSTLRPLEEQVIDFRLTLDYLRGKGKKFSYIDVRLASNTVYK